MSKDVSASLARVRQSAATLNQLCDEAAEAVRNLELYLEKECSVGIEARTTVSSERDEYHDESVHLCYGRCGDRFRVYVEWYYVGQGEPESYSSKPWAECKREQKLETIAYLIDLIDAIETNVVNRIEKARAAIGGIAKWTASTGKKEAANAKT